MIGYAFCGSFCTMREALTEMQLLVSRGYEVQPIVSTAVATTDTRFGRAADFLAEMERVSGRIPIRDVVGAEPLGPKTPLRALVIAPCTGNTLAKISRGITDTPVTMATKAHLRCDRPTLLSLASNDSMSGNLENIARLLLRKQIFFVPMRQDDPEKKPHSLVADFSRIPDALEAALNGKQLRPLFL